ncbi:hypothetical protein F4554_001831 [Actinopolymorpha rutila]|uniref:Uncharacterized protein n=1 Tax=Actinopolymorpha rutila TaxID=446787 RepID=A0A852ZA23_9ACTN|nr:hypothetical protein [Actinopolymorpha rutila]
MRIGIVERGGEYGRLPGQFLKLYRAFRSSGIPVAWAAGHDVEVQMRHRLAGSAVVLKDCRTGRAERLSDRDWHVSVLQVGRPFVDDQRIGQE